MAYLTVTLVVEWNPDNAWEADPEHWNWDDLADTRARVIAAHESTEEEIEYGGLSAPKI